MTALTLTPAQRSELRARAHHLHPVVMIGDAGLSQSVIAEIHHCLHKHELVKIKVFHDEAEQRRLWLDEICAQLDAGAVQAIGKLLVLYRPKQAQEIFELMDSGSKNQELDPTRKAGGKAPRSVKIVKPTGSVTHRPQVKRVTVLGNQRVTQGGMVKRSKPRQISNKKRALAE